MRKSKPTSDASLILKCKLFLHMTSLVPAEIQTKTGERSARQSQFGTYWLPRLPYIRAKCCDPDWSKPILRWIAVFQKIANHAVLLYPGKVKGI